MQTGGEFAKIVELLLMAQTSRAFRKYVTSYFGLCSTAMVAVRRACLGRMAKLTYHGLTKRCTSQVNPPALGKRLNPLFDTFIKAIALFQALLDLVVHVCRHGKRTVELTEHVELANARKV